MYKSICTMVSTQFTNETNNEKYLELNVDARKGLWVINIFWYDENDIDNAKTIKEFDNLKDAKIFYDDYLKSFKINTVIFNMFWDKDD